MDTKTNTDVYKVEGTQFEWVQSDSQRERKSRTNKVIEWAQTPTRVDSNTLKVGTNNTNRDTNRVAFESLPWSSLTLFLFVEFTVSLEASNQSSYCFTFLQSMSCYLSTVLSIRDYSLDFGLHTLSARLS